MQNKHKYCSFCSAPLVSEGDMFCAYCGARQTPQHSPAFYFFISILKSIAYVALFFGIQIVVSIVAEVAIIVKLGAEVVEGDLESVLTSEFGKWSWLCGIAEAILLVGILAVFFAVRKKNLFKEVRAAKLHPAAFGGCVVCGFGAQFAAVILLTLLYALMPFLASFSVSEDLANMMSAPSPLLDFLYIAILTPLMEEIVFRGLVYTRLRRFMNVGAAIVICGLIFGAAHMNIEQFLYAAPLGMLMAAVFEKYGSLWAPFAVHFAFNGGNYLVGYLPEEPAALPLALTVMGCGALLLALAFIFCTKSETKNEIKNPLQIERNF